MNKLKLKRQKQFYFTVGIDNKINGCDSKEGNLRSKKTRRKVHSQTCDIIFKKITMPFSHQQKNKIDLFRVRFTNVIKYPYQNIFKREMFLIDLLWIKKKDSMNILGIKHK